MADHGRSRTPDARRLLSTYRLQLTKDFDFGRAREIVPYLAKLGVSHAYTSPVLMARPGSTHGYDVVDPSRVNPELGGEDAFDAFVDALHAHGLGLVLDIVPNHMGTGPDNPYWEDVLRHGRASRYGEWFDIDWNPPRRSLRGKVLLPVLGAPLAEVIGKGEITLQGSGDAVRAKYYESSWPLAPETIPDDPAGVASDPARLRALLDAQHWQLVDWHRAANEINYRRFFDVSELISLRADREDVFQATHALPLRWVREGKVDALRIDHIDGLLEPRAYLDRLRDAVGPSVPIFVEKILQGDEHLRTNWRCDGTTGYEFLNQLESVFIDPRGAADVEREYRALLRIRNDEIGFREAAIRGKVLILRHALDADVHRLARWLAPLVHDVRRADLRESIIQMISCLPVYRTYVDREAPPVSDEDRALVERAVSLVLERGTPPAAAFRQLADLLVLRDADAMPEPDRLARVEWVERFQQLSGPATAKGIEDTALYRYVPLASLNEVGGEPDRPLADAVCHLHEANAERARHWPLSLNTVSTHDTKRSADVRSRIDALSELSSEWNVSVARWRRANAPYRTKVHGRAEPDANAEYLFYQSLLGVWPSSADVRKRLDEYMRKAAREAKAQTAWTAPDEEYERALSAFVQQVLRNELGNAFLGRVSQLAERVTRLGAWNAVSRVVLHLASPGTPDIYQGDDTWTHSLVDPDNRRAVNYELRSRLLDELARPGDGSVARDLLEDPTDPRLKLFVTHRMLVARRENAELFTHGAYIPLRATGAHADHVVAFARTHGSRAALAIAPRLTSTLGGTTSAPTGDAWQNTQLQLPPELAELDTWRDALTGADRTSLLLSDVLRDFPAALLIG